jgi:isopenicillin-N epimerase
MSHASRFALDPAVVFLNHGSFGACPLEVLKYQTALRQRLERQPVQFLGRELEPLMDQARTELAALCGADPQDLGFVQNATAGVNTVLRSLPLRPGDELLVTDHAYNACRNALDFVAAQAGAEVVVAPIPFPLRSSAEVVDAVLSRVTPRTRLFLLDHVTSPTALVLPAAVLVRELDRRGVDTLVDGAHVPGMLPLDLNALGAAYYTGNCHKWLCAPKSAALLHVRRDRQHLIRPLVISHGANSRRTDKSRLQLELDWVGTIDPTAILSIPAAIRCLSGLLPGGLLALQAHNHALALAGRQILSTALGLKLPCPDDMIGSMATLILPARPATAPAPTPPLYLEPLQLALLEQGIEVPIAAWPAAPRRIVRISAQIYNEPAHYHRLAAALKQELAET